MSIQLFQYDMNGALKNDLEDKINAVPQRTVSSNIALVHFSDWDNDDGILNPKEYHLVVFFSEDEFNLPVQLEGDKYRNFNRAWGCRTHILIDHFEQFADYIIANEPSEWQADAWVPNLDRLMAWAILCQGYLAAHGGDSLVGFDGVTEATKRRLAAIKDKTKLRDWWLRPVLAGTIHDPATVSFPSIKDLFEAELKGVEWEWGKAEALFKSSNPDPLSWDPAALRCFVYDFSNRFAELLPPGFTIPNE